LVKGTGDACKRKEYKRGQGGDMGFGGGQNNPPLKSGLVARQDWEGGRLLALQLALVEKKKGNGTEKPGGKLRGRG